MHSNVLNSKFLGQSQELRVQAMLDEFPRFAPWGAKEWQSFPGYQWTTVVSGKIPDTVLFRESDHAAVLEVPRYSNLIFANETTMAFTCTDDAVPTLYIVKLSQIENNLEPISLKRLAGSTFFPALNRLEILEAIPDVLEVIAGHYSFRGNHYVWTLNTKTGEYNHVPISWFNDSSPDHGMESVELIRVDPKTKVLIGKGAHIPDFVMSIDGSMLLTFVRKYRDGEIDANTMKLVENWTNRLAGNAKSYLS